MIAAIVIIAVSVGVGVCIGVLYMAWKITTGRGDVKGRIRP